MDNVATWLDQIRNTCQKIGQGYIDIIVDQCGLDFSIIPALSGFSPSLKWHSLYEGLPEDIYREDAPLLIRIDLDEEQQTRWLYELAREVSHTAPLLIVGSPWPFSTLVDWLGSCADASHEGRNGIFRFWDTRIFAYLFSNVLGDGGREQLVRPAFFWSWMDRDGQSVCLPGNGAVSTNTVCQQITFSDRQFEIMMCLCDAKKFLERQMLSDTYFSTKEDIFFACFNAMLQATDAGMLFEEERDTWVGLQLKNKFS